MQRTARSVRRLLVFRVVSVVLVLAAGSCGDGEEATPTSAPASAETTSTAQESTPPATARCSAADVPIPAAQDDLPDPVAALRSEILAAATACDFERLNELAVAGDLPFTHTDVLVEEYQNMSPGEFWQNGETQGTPILAFLVEDLSQPFEIEQDDSLGVVYVWRDPAACETLDDVVLCRLVEITEAGDWIAFYGQSA